MTAVEEVLEPVRLPRMQAGAQPQHLIVTLFGDYWFGRKEHLPSAGLVALAGEFDVSATSARAALSRLTRRGLLASSKVGRRTFYGLTPRAEGVLKEGQERIFSFGRCPATDWDGSWLVVVFSVPEAQRDVRHALRTKLRWLGFGPLYDGVWVSPRPVGQEVAAVLAECGVAHATVLRSTALYPPGPGPGHPLSAWNLDELRAVYEQFIADFEPLLERVRTGQVSASEALAARTAIMDTWRTFPNLDPELPEDMLPPGWPRRRVYDIFAEVYDVLGPLAEFRFRQIVSLHAPEFASLANHFTTQTALSLSPRRPRGRRSG